MGHDVKKGDVFVESWGYDQTNVDYYLVVRTTPASVYLVKCGAKTVGEGHGLRLVPDTDKPQPFEVKARTRVGKSNHRGEVIKRIPPDFDGWINLTSYSGGRLWDGESSHFDTLAAGYMGH